MNMRRIIDIVAPQVTLTEAATIKLKKTDSGAQVSTDTVTVTDETSIVELADQIATFLDWNDRGEIEILLPSGKTLNYFEDELRQFYDVSSYESMIRNDIKRELGDLL